MGGRGGGRGRGKNKENEDESRTDEELSVVEKDLCNMGFSKADLEVKGDTGENLLAPDVAKPGSSKEGIRYSKEKWSDIVEEEQAKSGFPLKQIVVEDQSAQGDRSIGEKPSHSEFPPLQLGVKSGQIGDGSLQNLINTVTGGADPVTLPPPKRDWVSVVQGNRDVSNGWKLKYDPPEKGVVKITAAERAEVEQVWEKALVGYVLEGKPRYMEMNNFARRRWRDYQVTRVTMLHEGIYLYEFQTKEMKQAVLEKKWFYNDRPLILRPWSANLNLKEIDVKKVPVWVQFTNMPLDLWSSSIVQKMASCIGTPLASDKLTANRDRLSFARVLIDVEIKDSLPRSIPVEMDDGSIYRQPIYFEWRPERWVKCKKYGHGSAVCNSPPITYWQTKPIQPQRDNPPAEKVEKSVVEKRQEASSSSSVMAEPVRVEVTGKKKKETAEKVQEGSNGETLTGEITHIPSAEAMVGQGLNIQDVAITGRVGSKGEIKEGVDYGPKTPNG